MAISSPFPPSRFQDAGRETVKAFMNRASLIEYVQKGLGKDASRVAADRAVSLVIEGIKVGLRKDKAVQLVGFGTFKVVERKARLGTNPMTLQPLNIKQSRTVKLAIGKELKDGL